VASTLNTAGLYFLGCAAAWVLHQRGTRTLGPPIDLGILPAAAAIGMASMVALVCVAGRAEILGLLAVILVSTGLYGATRLAGRG